MSSGEWNVRDIAEAREKREDAKYSWWNVMAMCLPCSHRWIATVPTCASLFGLQCPGCGAEESFASFIPDAYCKASLEEL